MTYALKEKEKESEISKTEDPEQETETTETTESETEISEKSSEQIIDNENLQNRQVMSSFQIRYLYRV